VAQPNLTESAWERGRDDAASTYRTTSFAVFLAIAELLAVPAAILLTASHEDSATQIASPLLSGAIALVATFAIVLIAQLAAAPIRQRNELRDAWRNPEPPIDPELALMNLRRRGDDLLRSIRSASYTADHESAAEIWTTEVFQLLSENCDAALPKKFVNASNGSSLFVPSLERRIEVLDEIIGSREQIPRD
jgi:hypothetical protein